jgi:hypothetical protein
MDVLSDSLEDSIQLDFDLARADLAAARRAQQAQDSSSARRQVNECRATVDRILDMWNDVLLTSA